MSALTGLALAVLGSTVALAAPTPTPIAPEDPLQVSISELLPRAPQPKDTVVVAGTVTNTGSTRVTDIRVRLKLGERVFTRGGLHDADTDRPITRPQTSVAPHSATLAPGARTAFTIRTTVRALGLSGVGVYPIDIEARGNAGEGIGPLGLASTWLPYFAGTRVNPIRVAVVWPLVDRPHQATDGSFRDDELADSLAGDGRLGRMLAAGAAAFTRQCDPSVQPVLPGVPVAPPRCESVPVTYALDPDLLLAANTMREPYRVGTGKTSSGRGQDAARGWLARLKQAVGRGALVALPYADPDVSAMTKGVDASFREDLSYDAALSRTAVQQNLGTPVLDTVAWPPAGPVTADAIDLLSRSGATSLVLDPTAFDEPDNEPTRTPSARTLLPATVGGPLQGLVADDYLSRLVLGGSDPSQGSRLLEQRFLAETAVIAAEAPSLTRTLLIAPERRADLVSTAAAAALHDLGRVPWLCPVTVGAVASATEHCSGRPAGRVPVAENRGPLVTTDVGELSSSYLGQVGMERDRARQLTDAVLIDTLSSSAQRGVTEMKARLHRSVARAESSAWRTDPGATTEAAQLHDDVQQLIGKVVVRGGQVVLTSNSGTVQVSVENTLPDVPVKVRVRFTARTLGLVIPTSGVVEVLPGHAVPVTVKATAQKSGQFVVDAQLLDRNGRPFGRPSPIYVRSTRYGRLALAVTIGAAGVLLVAAGVRLARRAMRRSGP